MATRKLRDSSKTRVEPVLDAVSGQPNWVTRLLATVVDPAGRGLAPFVADDPSPTQCAWGSKERPLAPPRALLEWLIRNLGVRRNYTWSSSPTDKRRQLLVERDSRTIEEALSELDRRPTGRGWHILEGPSFPDALVETAEYLLVIEGKRTERKLTTSTTWLDSRQQMWRHIDAAWEVRAGRQVVGILVVEGPDGATIPNQWLIAATTLASRECIAGSLPHRDDETRGHMRNSFRGVTTWQRVAAAFDMDWRNLPETVSDVEAWRSRASSR